MISSIINAGLFSIILVLLLTSPGLSEEDLQVEPVVRPDVTSTEEVINNTKVVYRDDNNNIQSPHHSIDFSLQGDSLQVEDVDDYGRLYGSSMQPTIFDGHTVITRSFDGQDLEPGDIVRFEKDGKPYIHRVKGDYQSQGYVVTQGDNNKRNDGKINTSKITDIVIGVLMTEDKE